MPRKRLTDAAIERMTTTERRIEVWDTYITGLVLRVTKQGATGLVK